MAAAESTAERLRQELSKIEDENRRERDEQLAQEQRLKILDLEREISKYLCLFCLKLTNINRRKFVFRICVASVFNRPSAGVGSGGLSMDYSVSSWVQNYLALCLAQLHWGSKLKGQSSEQCRSCISNFSMKFLQRSC